MKYFVVAYFYFTLPNTRETGLPKVMSICLVDSILIAFLVVSKMEMLQRLAESSTHGVNAPRRAKNTNNLVKSTGQRQSDRQRHLTLPARLQLNLNLTPLSPDLRACILVGAGWLRII